MNLAHFLMGLFLDLRYLVFLEVCECCLICCFLEETDESGDDVEEESDEVGSESGSFVTNGTCEGVP